MLIPIVTIIFLTLVTINTLYFLVEGFKSQKGRSIFYLITILLVIALVLFHLLYVIYDFK